MSNSQPICLYCERDSDQVPLLPVRFREADLWICPQHLPIMIHKPAQLAGKLPGIENMGPAQAHDHG